MNEVLIIEEFESFAKAIFYTIRFDDEELSETEKFFKRFQEASTNEGVVYKENLDNLVKLIQKIGQKKGALKIFFNRFENDANTLPPKTSEWKDNNLRLCCIWISKEIVILGNGGIKTAQTVQDSPDLIDKFRLMNRVAREVQRRLNKGEINIEDSKLTGDLEIFIRIRGVFLYYLKK